jgi:hypothetical protein
MPPRPTEEALESCKTAFVICPIGEPQSEIRKRSDQILKHVIGPAVAEQGYKVIRADQISEPGIITTQVINHIINDDLVVADLTGHNPNVFYELAIRHAIKKPVVQIIQKDEKIPFDVSTTRTIPLDYRDLDSVDETKRELIKQIKAVERDPSKVDSPVSMAVDLNVLEKSQNPQLKVMADLKAMMNELNRGMSEVRDSLRLFYDKPLLSLIDRNLAEVILNRNQFNADKAYENQKRLTEEKMKALVERNIAKRKRALSQEKKEEPTD